MAIKKVQLPDNTTLDVQDSRVVSDAIVYVGDEMDDATYTSGGAVVDLSDYQPLLVSGTNIKTVNNQSLLGSGNISISGGSGGGGDENVIEAITFNGTAATIDSSTKTAAITYTPPVTSVNGSTGAVTVSVPTESTVSGWGFTKNAGTITGITMNNISKGTSGVVDLGTVITSETALSKGTTTGSGNAVTDISVSGHTITLTKGTTFQKEITISSSEPTSSDGSNGDIWIVV